MTVHTLRGSGDRLHAENQAARLRHMADELENDWSKYTVISEPTKARFMATIDRYRQDAKEFDSAIAAYDARHRQLTPGEIESAVKP